MIFLTNYSDYKVDGRRALKQQGDVFTVRGIGAQMHAQCTAVVMSPAGTEFRHEGNLSRHSLAQQNRPQRLLKDPSIESLSVLGGIADNLNRLIVGIDQVYGRIHEQESDVPCLRRR